MQNNMFTDTISRFRNNTTVQELTLDFKSQMRLKIFKRSTLQPDNLLKKYGALQRKYAKAPNPNHSEEWQENERKIFLWFILAYSRLHFKKLSEMTDKEWSEISTCFGGKNVLLMKFEARSLERSTERVRWTPLEEEILSSCIKGQLNGKWAEISRLLFFKTEGEYYKTAKQCRQHWLNHMDQQIKRGEWTVDEDLIILNHVLASGHHWSNIVDKLSSRRTEHMVKNRFGSLLSCGKKLLKIQRESIAQQKLIPYLIQELTTNKEFVNTAKVKDSSSDGLQQLGSSPSVKEEENQNYYALQKTDIFLPKKQLSVVKVERAKENLQTVKDSHSRQCFETFPQESEAAFKISEMPFQPFAGGFSVPQVPFTVPQIHPFMQQRDFSSFSSLKFSTGRQSDSPFFLQARPDPMENPLLSPTKPFDNLTDDKVPGSCSTLRNEKFLNP